MADTPDLKAITYEVEAGVALITLARPERLNAWTTRMEREYRWALTAADADPAVRVAVVTGAGRGFCAGADFRALDGLAEAGGYAEGEALPAEVDGLGTRRPDFAHPHSYPLGMAKPLIAAVNGPAAGVGFVLMCFADIRFAAAGAKLTTSFGRLGLPAEHGVSWVLARLIGPARAADLLFSSRVVLAEEAVDMGLVNRVLPPDALLTETLAYARTMAAEISPVSLRVMKAQLWEDQIHDLHTAAARAEALLDQLLGGPDFSEGVAAARDKRPPRF
ncbi:MAG TPA: enoyl-CoA hydratase-related protein [Acidimicrobiales bacterium]|nr:enoyl-CoA hydratase-related protein [Acidimicrobiales bacterium]